MKIISRIKMCVITALCILVCTAFYSGSVDAVENGKADIFFYAWSSYEVENDRGEVLKYDVYAIDILDPAHPFLGNMKMYKKKEIEETGWWATVDDSKKFILKAVKDENSKYYIAVDVYRDNGEYFVTQTSDAESIEINGTTTTINPVPGRTCKYDISVHIPSHHREYSIKGYTSEPLTFKKDGKGMLISKANGKVRIAIYEKKNKKWNDGVEGHYYFYNENVKISSKGTKLNVSSGIKIDQKSRKDIKNVKLQVTNKGNNMFLKWDKVKKAKSYIVYRYNDSSKKFERETVRSSNYYDISNPPKNKVYKYKVEARTGKNGGGKKIAKRSYEVWAVAGGSTKTNATKVEVKKKKITAKKGKKIKVKATVKKKGSKPLLSKKVSWHTSNSKIAAVDKKTGKIVMKKRGKCTIWAKSHNGVNSKSIKITVR